MLRLERVKGLGGHSLDRRLCQKLVTRLQSSQELMHRVREIALGRHEGEVIEMTFVDAHLLIMYSRLRSLLEGACVLLKARLPAEAIILGRQMFTDSLHLTEIASRGPGRAPLILGLVNDTLTEWENLERQSLSLGVSSERDQAVLGHVAKRRKQIDSYRRRHGIGRLERFRDEKQLAAEQGRLDEYLDFQFAHRMVHRPDMAQAGRIIKKADILGIHLRNPDDNWVAAVSAFIMSSALRGHRAVVSIFGWTETSPAEVDQLLAEIEELFPAESLPPGESP